METRETTKETIGCLPKKVEKKEVIETPIMVKDLKTGKTSKGIIYAGVRDLKQDPNNFEVEPIINYCFSRNEYSLKRIKAPLDFDY